MTPLFPDYTTAKSLLSFLQGVNINDYKEMIKSIYQLTGTPQDTVDWKMPSEWIPSRLEGKDKELALKLWEIAQVNPRHLRGSNMLFKRHSLLNDFSSQFEISKRGEQFINNDLSKVEVEIDGKEGIHKILKLIFLKKSAKSAEIFDDWRDYLLSKTNYSKNTAMYSLLRYRLANSIERGLIDRISNNYQLTDKGLNYLNSLESKSDLKEEMQQESLENDLKRTLSDFSNEQRKELKKKLHEMNPYRFENLIGELLEAMGYEDVEVTQASKDKGVDVLGTVQNGISTVREVIQVKRFKNNINRSTVAQLRGDIPIFDAYRGTIITTSDFTKDAKNTALDNRGIPVTLINGEKLIDLMIEHEIGIISKPVKYFTIDEEAFNDDELDQ